MSSAGLGSSQRLQSDLHAAKRLTGFRVESIREDFREWLFVFRGADETPFEGGEYMSVIEFPSTWPHNAPTIRMMTPSGRFFPGDPISIVPISMCSSQFWSPLMSIESLLVGFQSYMADAYGSGIGEMIPDDGDCRQLAKESHAWNLRSELYRKHFADSLA